MIDLRRLRYFVTVADELHFGRAAQRLHISQPSLSQQIQALEQEIGAQLLQRDRRSVSLTPAGARLMEEGRALIWRVEELGATIGRVARGQEGRLIVGFVGPAMARPLSLALRRFRRRHPGVRLILWHRGTNEQMKALRSGEQDVGFLRPFHHDLTELATRLVDRQRYVLALPHSHPLLRHRRVRLEELGDEPLVLFPRATHPALYDRMIEACATAGYVPSIIHEANTKAMALELVRVGVGVALVPEGQTTSSNRGLLRPVTGSLPTVDIVAAWRKSSEISSLPYFLENLCTSRQH